MKPGPEPGFRAAFTPGQQREIAADYDSRAMSLRQVAKKHGCSVTLVVKICARWGVKPNAPFQHLNREAAP